MTRLSIRWLLGELRRRKVYQTVALYVVGAWVVLQVADLAFAARGIDERALAYVWLSGFCLFPLALLFAWRYDFRAGHIRRTLSREADEEADDSLRAGDRWIIGALGAIASSVLAWAMINILTTPAPLAPPPIQPPADNSIAVMPFHPCAAHEDDAVLAAGLATEVINRLAALDRLKVIARASSFAVAGYDLTLPEVARTLGVRHLLIGESCRDGDELTLSAEMVDSDGFARWSGNFTQSGDWSGGISVTIVAEISEAIAVKLGYAQPGRSAVVADRRAYEQLVIARELAFRNDFDEAHAALEKALQYDPEYAEALFEQARLTIWRSLSAGALGYSSMREARPVAQRALEMARRSLVEGRGEFDSYSTLSLMLFFTGRWEQSLAWSRQGELDEAELSARLDDADKRFREAEAHARTAITLNPSDIDQHILLGYIVERQGLDRRSEALEIFERALEVDPLNVKINRQVAKRRAARGGYRQAMELMERFRRLPEVPHDAWFVPLEIMWIQRYWDEQLVLMIEMLRRDRSAMEHDGNFGRVVWFAGQLARLGLFEAAEDWYRRVEPLPAEGWATVLRGWALSTYTEHMGLEEESPDDSESVADLTDEEILEQGLFDAVYELDDYDRAIRLAESMRHGRFESTFWAERMAFGDLRLAALYQAAERHAQAAALLEEIVADLETQYDDGIRHPAVLELLATAYAMHGRNDDAIAMLGKAVDYHLRWFEVPDHGFYQPWAALRDDPRFVDLVGRMVADLRQQGERIRTTLAQTDLDELLGSAPANPEQ